MREDIRGEDTATVVLNLPGGMHVTCEMSYAGTQLAADCFPETQIFVEGTCGSIRLGSGYQICITNGSGTCVVHAPPEHYDWADQDYLVVHSSIVPAQKNLLDGLRGLTIAETTGQDNLRTMRLVAAAYESAACNAVIHLNGVA